MVLIQQAAFNSADLIDALRQRSAGAAGALVTFTGYVRDYATAATTQSLPLEHYPGMFEDENQALLHHAHSAEAGDEHTAAHRVCELRRARRVVFLARGSTPPRQ